MKSRESGGVMLEWGVPDSAQPPLPRAARRRLWRVQYVFPPGVGVSAPQRKKDRKDLNMIRMRDAMRVVAQNRRGDIVIATETSISAWADVTDDVTLDLPIPAMSKGALRWPNLTGG